MACGEELTTSRTLRALLTLGSACACPSRDPRRSDAKAESAWLTFRLMVARNKNRQGSAPPVGSRSLFQTPAGLADGFGLKEWPILSEFTPKLGPPLPSATATSRATTGIRQLFASVAIIAPILPTSRGFSKADYTGTGAGRIAAPRVLGYNRLNRYWGKADI